MKHARLKMLLPVADRSVHARRIHRRHRTRVCQAAGCKHFAGEYSQRILAAGKAGRVYPRGTF